MNIITILDDLTSVKGYDAIVNPTNIDLKPKVLSRGIDMAINKKAGFELAMACDKIGGCAVGKAVITDGYRLPCKKVIHTVGPTWKDAGTEQAQLEDCYYSVLELAKKSGIKRLAFPPISAGSKKYPLEEEAEIAIETVSEFCECNPDVFEEIAFVLSDESTKTEYDKVLARRGLASLGYLSFLFEIKSYDDEQVFDLIKKMLEEKLEDSQDSIKKSVMSMISFIPDSTPEDMLVFVTRHRQIKKFITSMSNEMISEQGFDFKIRDILVRRRNKDDSLQLIIEVEGLDFTKLIDSMSQKIDTKDMEYGNLVLPAIKIVNETIPEEVKTDLLVNIVTGLQTELGELIETMAKEKADLDIKIGTIEMLK